MLRVALRFAVALSLTLIIVGANSALAQELEVKILLNKSEYNYAPAEAIDGYVSVSRPSRIQLWVQYPDHSWNLWVYVDRVAGTYRFSKSAVEVPRSALAPGYNLLVFRVIAVDRDGNTAEDVTLAWLKV